MVVPVLLGLPTPVDAAQMKVKRLNWEKIEVVNENSVWAHVRDTARLLSCYISSRLWMCGEL